MKTKKAKPNSSYWRRVLVCTAVALPLLAFNLFLLHQRQAYISDEVVQQVMLADVHNGQHLQIRLGEDTFAMKFPLYALMGAVMQHSATALFITCLICTGVMLLLFNCLQFLFHKSWGVGLVLSLFLAAAGGYALFWLRIPNLRNIEMPLAALTVLAASWFYLEEYSFSRWILAGLIVAAGMQVGSDPYALYVFVIPMILTTVALAHNRRVMGARMLVYALGVLITWKIFKVILAHVGITMVFQNVKPPLHTLGQSLKYAVGGLGYILSDKQVSGPTMWTNRAIALLAMAAMVYAAWVAVQLFRQRDEAKRASFRARWMLVYGAFVLLCCFGAYVASGEVMGNANHRYLIGMLMGFLLVTIGLYAADHRHGRIVVAAIAFMAVLSVSTNIAWAHRTPTIDQQKDAKLLRSYTAKTSVKIGIADYWNAAINTYYSNGAYRVLPAVCNPGGIGQYIWAMNQENFLPDLNLANEGHYFIFLDSSINNVNQHFYGTFQCTVNDVERLLPGRHFVVYRIDQYRDFIVVE